MLFSEFLAIENELVESIKNSYGDDVYNYISKRFANFELLYPEETFKNLFDVVLLECDILLRQIKNTHDKLDDLLTGTTSTSSGNSNNLSSGDSKISYCGYNVQGDFQTTNSSSSSQITNRQTTNTTSTLDELITLLSNDLTTFYDKLYTKMLPLFVTIF